MNGEPSSSTRHAANVGPWRRCYVAIGANLGDRAGTIASALRDLGDIPDVCLMRCSTLIETNAVGGPADQPDYLNGVVELETSLSAEALLERLLAVEARHGRERTVQDGPRTLDLDLLLYGEERIATPRLTVPHPRMWQRRFVLEPLEELLGRDQVARLVARYARS